MLYDGDCPLCMREVNFLRGRWVRGRVAVRVRSGGAGC
jgi:predicted DCC family thiol-disulfide oxidoreductase YuxK